MFKHQIFLVILYIIFGNPNLGLCESPQPGNKDLLTASTGMGIAVGIELFAKEYLLPAEPRFSQPNQIDVKMRKKLYWGAEKQDLAKGRSDYLIYAVSLSSLVWAPLLAEDSKTAALINMEVFAVNSLATNMIKICAARERPYHYFNTRSSGGAVDFASFVSGHSSVAFSQAVANSMILSRSFPGLKTEIWTSLLGLAGYTAYLRVAGDMHYFSDIVLGAGLGSLIAWTITRQEQKRFDKGTDIPINISMMFKIPLG
ncbi:phosphatase PAP2 family protein [bacterium]|nr:phosphatase PAP2 family protein [bacterium]